MFKTICTKFPRSNLNSEARNYLGKFFCEFIKKTNFTNKNSTTSDFFESNFKLDTAPNQMPAFNDLDNSFATEIFNKLDTENLTNVPLIVGKFSRLWCLTEDTIHHFVMFLTHEVGMGIGFSTVVLATLIRLIFFPIHKRNYKNMQLSRLLNPDLAEIRERASKLTKSGEVQLAAIENAKITKMQKEFGVKNNAILAVLNASQFLIFGCWTGLVQRFSYHVEDYPELMTGGFLWFKDLSMTDPYFILPAINSLSILLNTYGQNNHYTNIFMLKARRFFFIIPLMSFPIMCTLETGIVLYFVIQSIMMYLMNFTLNTYPIKKKMGLLNYLPGTKLDRLNKIRLVNEKIQTVEVPHIEDVQMKENKHSADSQSQQDKKTTANPSQQQKQTKKEKTKESLLVASIKKRRK